MTKREKAQVAEVTEHFIDAVWYYKSHGVDLQKKNPVTGKSVEDEIISTMYDDFIAIKENRYESKETNE